MNREALFTRILLRGLAEAEVRDYIARTASVEPPRELVRRIFEETEGNPFFLAEVVQADGARRGRSARHRSPISRIPEGVKQALGRRLDRLSDEANVLLTTLAVVGRECDHALLAGALRARRRHDCCALIEEALRARVLEETGRRASTASRTR